MKKKLFLLSLFALIFLTQCSTDKSPAAPEQSAGRQKQPLTLSERPPIEEDFQVTVAYSSNVGAYLEPCG